MMEMAQGGTCPVRADGGDARRCSGEARRRMPVPGARRRQATVQDAPLRANEVGLAALPLWVTWKPMSIDPLAGMAAL